MSQVRYSAHAAAIYLAAQGAEVMALCAYVIETQGLDKKSRVQYNHLVADALNLSLKTMQNRASVAVKIQDKYGVAIAAYLECNEENVRAMSHLLVGEMGKSGHQYARHLDDISRFLEGKIPAREEQAQAAQRAKDAAEARKQAQAAADKKQAETVAQNQADMSGTPDTPSSATVPPAGATVGNADKSENRGESKPEVVPMPEKKSKVLLVVEQAEDGALELDGLENMSLEQIEGLMKFISLELANRTKKAA